MASRVRAHIAHLSDCTQRAAMAGFAEPRSESVRSAKLETLQNVNWTNDHVRGCKIVLHSVTEIKMLHILLPMHSLVSEHPHNDIFRFCRSRELCLTRTLPGKWLYLLHKVWAANVHLNDFLRAAHLWRKQTANRAHTLWGHRNWQDAAPTRTFSKPPLGSILQIWQIACLRNKPVLFVKWWPISLMKAPQLVFRKLAHKDAHTDLSNYFACWQQIVLFSEGRRRFFQPAF